MGVRNRGSCRDMFTSHLWTIYLCSIPGHLSPRWHLEIQEIQWSPERIKIINNEYGIFQFTCHKFQLFWKTLIWSEKVVLNKMCVFASEAHNKNIQSLKIIVVKSFHKISSCIWKWTYSDVWNPGSMNW